MKNRSSVVGALLSAALLVACDGNNPPAESPPIALKRILYFNCRAPRNRQDALRRQHRDRKPVFDCVAVRAG